MTDCQITKICIYALALIVSLTHTGLIYFGTSADGGEKGFYRWVRTEIITTMCGIGCRYQNRQRMQKMDRNEQWKLEGKCIECRKQSYCKKTCSAAKAAIQRAIVETISQTKVGRLAMLIMQQGGADYGQE